MTTLETVLLRRNWGYFTKNCESGAADDQGGRSRENQLFGPGRNLTSAIRLGAHERRMSNP